MEKTYKEDDVGFILGDNIFYGQGFTPILSKVKETIDGATIFGYRVKDPRSFRVAEIDKDNKAISIEEKPKNRNQILQSLDYIFTTTKL